MNKRWTKWLSDMENLMLPRFCPVCSQRLMPSERFLCMACAMDLPRIDLEPINDNAMTRKMWSQVPVAMGTSVIAYRHQSPFHNILINIKYHGATELALEMGRWAAWETMSTNLFEQTDCLNCLNRCIFPYCGQNKYTQSRHYQTSSTNLKQHLENQRYCCGL